MGSADRLGRPGARWLATALARVLERANGADRSRPLAARTSVAVVMLAWNPQNARGAARALAEQLRAAAPNARLVLVDNRGDGMEWAPDEGFDYVVGDNSAREFSGLQAGIEHVRKGGSPEVWVLANDRYAVDSDECLRLLDGPTFDAVAEMGALSGHLDRYPTATNAFGLEIGSWARSNLLVAADDALRQDRSPGDRHRGDLGVGRRGQCPSRPALPVRWTARPDVPPLPDGVADRGGYCARPTLVSERARQSGYVERAPHQGTERPQRTPAFGAGTGSRGSSGRAGRRQQCRASWCRFDPVPTRDGERPTRAAAIAATAHRVGGSHPRRAASRIRPARERDPPLVALPLARRALRSTPSADRTTLGAIGAPSTMARPLRAPVRPSALGRSARVSELSRSISEQAVEQAPTHDAVSQPLEGVTVARFGCCERTYARNRIMAAALTRAGATVIDLVDCRRFTARTPALLARRVGPQPDLFLVAFPGHLDVVTAKLLARRKKVPVVFDLLAGLHESNVTDRRSVARSSLGAGRYLVEDVLSCHAADLIILDTNAHISYLSRLTHVSPNHFRRVWLGTDDSVMAPPRRQVNVDVDVLFYGNVTPLHGVDTILSAARLLQDRGVDVTFRLVVGGSERPAVARSIEALGLRSMQLSGPLPYDELAAQIARSQLCLGVFGTSPKSQRVIPNKAFDTLAMAKPLITADTSASREALVHGKHAWLCAPGDAPALAEAIEELHGNSDLRTRVALAGHELYQRAFSTAALTDAVGRVFAEALSAC